MKMYNIDNGSVLIVGETVEIKAICGSLRRAEKETVRAEWHGNYAGYRTGLVALFMDHPKFKPYTVYGIEITEDGYWFVLSADTVLRVLGMI